jgi:SAM-dependent methyltransferase
LEPEVYGRFYVAEDSHWWFRARRRLIASVVEQLYPGGGLDIADVGCGTGGMTQMLARFGRVTGVDEAAEAREYCARRGVGDVVSLDEWERTNTLYDLVTAFDVVEHVEDDLSFVAGLRERLRPGGRIVVTVPAYPALWSVFDEMNHHQRRYTRGPLTKLLGAAGFVVERASYFNTVLFAPVALTRLTEKITKPPTSDRDDRRKTLDRWFKVGPMNGILEALFGLERHWLRHGNFAFGSSILALGKKES